LLGFAVGAKRLKGRGQWADATQLVAAQQLDAYFEARLRQQDAHNAEASAHRGRVARALARITGKRVGLHTSTRAASRPNFRPIAKPARQLGLSQRQLHCQAINFPPALQTVPWLAGKFSRPTAAL
jgi:hypothetical protein